MNDNIFKEFTGCYKHSEFKGIITLLEIITFLETSERFCICVSTKPVGNKPAGQKFILSYKYFFETGRFKKL